MTVLAGLPEGAALAARDLAAFHGVSEPYLLKHLKLMVRAGVLDSAPGPSGGFRLARPARDIRLLDILEAIEGRFAPFQCAEIRQRAPIAAPAGAFRLPCQIHAAMREAERSYRAVLSGVTIADIAADVSATLPAARKAAAESWFQTRLRIPSSRVEKR